MTAPPERIGPYRVTGVLGEGSLGVVYLGERAGKMAAIKTVHGAGHGLPDLIRRELAGLSRVRHPGIVEILDAGEDQGVPWIAMAHVEGRSLRTHLAPALPTWDGEGEPPDAPVRRGASTLPLGEGLAIVHRLCASLAHLHGEGLVHRDLKPENVIVRPDGQPVLVDFGLHAAFAGSYRDSLDTLSLHGGTPTYMAPEQVLREPVDARADLYALGVLLFEIATGRPPFVGRSAEVMRAHAERKPPRISNLRVVPPELDRLVDELLAEDPHDRPGHADDVAHVLSSMDAGEPLGTASRRPWLYRPRISGRDDVLAEVLGKLFRSLEGSGGLVVLRGEAGVGKTRLAAEVLQRLREEGRSVGWGACPPTRAEPLGGLRPVLRAICRRSAAARKCLLGTRGAVLGRFEPALGVPNEVPCLRDQVFSHLRQFLSAETGPRFVVLDDLQDADELLAAFVAWVAVRPIPNLAILATWRSGADDEAVPGTVVPVVGVGRDDVARIVADMLAHRAPPEALVDEVASRSGGNPFFVAEYLRTAVDEGLLTRAEGRWHARLPASFVLGTVEELCRRRLARLSPAARRVTCAAALLGHTVDPERLLRIAAVPEAAVAETEARQILHRSPEGALHFVHDRILREAAALLPPSEVAALHRAAADQVEQDGGDPAVVAHHLTAAGETARARPFLLRTARGAFERLAIHEALIAYRRWLSSADPADRETSRVRTEMAARVLGNLCGHAEAIVELERAEAEARAISDGEGVIRAVLGQAEILREVGRFAESIARCALLDALAGDDPYWKMRLRLEQSLQHRELGDFSAQRQVLEEALGYARSADDPKGEGIALLGLAGVALQEGQSREALWLQQAGEVLLEERDPYALAGMVVNHLVFRLALDPPEELELEAIRLEQLYRKADLPAYLAVTLAVAATCRERLGRLAEAELAIREAIDLSRTFALDRYADQLLEDLARIVLHDGRPEEALGIALQAVEACREHAPRGLQHAWLRVAACHLQLGAPDAAEAALGEAAAVEVTDLQANVESACLRAEVCLARGEPGHTWFAAAERAAKTAEGDHAARLVARLAERIAGA